MRVWITKYALSTGVMERDAKDTGQPGMIEVGKGTYYHGEGRDWHRTKESALARVKVMIEAKRKSLAKQQAALADLAAKVAEGVLPGGE